MIQINAIFLIAFIWIFVSGNFKTNFQNPNSLSSEDIEKSVVELKKKIFTTNSFEKNDEYQKIYLRLDALMSQILRRHRHFLLDVEAKGSLPFDFFKSEYYYDTNFISQKISHFARDFDKNKYTPEQLIYTCFFLWHGGHVKYIGEIKSDPNSKLISVMMPFSPAYRGTYEAIKRVAVHMGLECLRADDIWENSTFIQDIFDLIFCSRIVIVDFSERNPNVMYETGIAHTLGKVGRIQATNATFVLVINSSFTKVGFL